MNGLVVIRDGIVLAFQLLTTIPIRKEVPWDDERARLSVASYPLTGFVLGLLLAAQAYLLLTYTTVSFLIITAWLMTISIIYSGGLHLDGWADFSDAVFSRRDIAKKLEIMKDSRVGAFGVLSLLALLGWRFVLMYESIIHFGEQVIVAFFLIPFLTRLNMGSQVLFGTFAREDGMARALKPAKVPLVNWIYIGWLFLAVSSMLFIAPIWLWLFAALILFHLVWARFCSKQIGGITGDTIGAGTEGSETWLWLIALLLHLFVMG